MCWSLCSWICRRSKEAWTLSQVYPGMPAPICSVSPSRERVCSVVHLFLRACFVYQRRLCCASQQLIKGSRVRPANLFLLQGNIMGSGHRCLHKRPRWFVRRIRPIVQDGPLAASLSRHFSFLSPDEQECIGPTTPAPPAPLRSLPSPATPIRRIVSPRGVTVLHPGAGLYPRVYRVLSRPRVGVSSPPHLLDWVHDTVDGRGDRVRCLVTVNVCQRTELDNPGERCSANLVRHVQRPQRAVWGGMIRSSALTIALRFSGLWECSGLGVFWFGSFRVGVIFLSKTALIMLCFFLL